MNREVKQKFDTRRWIKESHPIPPYPIPFIPFKFKVKCLRFTYYAFGYRLTYISSGFQWICIDENISGNSVYILRKTFLMVELVANWIQNFIIIRNGQEVRNCIDATWNESINYESFKCLSYLFTLPLQVGHIWTNYCPELCYPVHSIFSLAIIHLKSMHE